MQQTAECPYCIEKSLNNSILSISVAHKIETITAETNNDRC